MEKVEIGSVDEKVVAGMEYICSAIVTFADATSKVYNVTFQQLNDFEKNPVENPEAEDSADKPTGKTKLRDLFHLVNVEPELCPPATPVTPELLQEADGATPVEYATGAIMPENIEYLESEVTDEAAEQIPSDWDWRDHITNTHKAQAVQALNQGSCGSCWAFASATALSYQFNIQSQGQYDVVPSPQVGMSCASESPCNGGWMTSFFDAMQDSPNVAHQTVAYTGAKGQCAANSDSIGYYCTTSGGRSSKAFRGEADIVREIYTNGPATAAIAAVGGFGNVKNEIYQGSASENSQNINHAVVIVGFGTDNGQKYWLIQNSWGAGWGDGQGFMRLRRGQGDLKVEEVGITQGFVKVQGSECTSATKCENGGFFNNKDTCGCTCDSGFSGATCSGCTKECSGNRFTGTSGVVGGECMCTCKAGHLSPTNLEGYDDCALEFASQGVTSDSLTVKFDSIPGSMAADKESSCGHWAGSMDCSSSGNIRFPDSTVETLASHCPTSCKVLTGVPNDSLQRVKKGDMLVAVQAGNQPWTAESGWNTGISSTVCGDKKWPVEVCTQTDVTLSFSSAAQGSYDVYYVKWQGMNEFGVDKGYGNDFMKVLTVAHGSGGSGGSSPVAPVATPTRPPTVAPTDAPATNAPTNAPANDCQDNSSHCSGWTDYCTGYKYEGTPIGELCPQTCGTCEGGGSSTPSGDDSCQYAKDNACDEPTYCTAGTDATDCA